MKLSKKTIETAKEIRKDAARKWDCEVVEIDWVSCLGMAMRGEELEMETIHEYKFDIEGKHRNGGVYVAIITGKDEKFGFARDFLPLEWDQDKKIKKVWGTTKLENGTIVEIATGGSAKNKYQEAYVTKGGELERIGWMSDIDTRKEISHLLAK